MSKDTIREAINAQPFQPFTVRMADGNAYPVPARDFVSLAPNGRTLVIFGEAGKIKLLDSMLVTEIERESESSSLSRILRSAGRRCNG